MTPKCESLYFEQTLKLVAEKNDGMNTQQLQFATGIQTDEESDAGPDSGKILSTEVYSTNAK